MMISVPSDRRMPRGENPEAFDGGTPEYTAPMQILFYPHLVTECNTVTISNGGNKLSNTCRNTLRLTCNTTAGRKLACLNACQGLKLAKLNSAALARKSERINSGKGAVVHGRPGEVEKLTLIRLFSKTWNTGHGTYPSFGTLRLE